MFNPFSQQQGQQQGYQQGPNFPPPMPMGMPCEMYEHTKYYRGGMMPSYQQAPPSQRQGLPLPGIPMFGGKLYILPIFLIPLFFFGGCGSLFQPIQPPPQINNVINVDGN